MPTAWKWQAKDKDGNVVEAAPGQPWFFCRGPETLPQMIEGARILLNNRRVDAKRFGLPDPGYVLDESSIQAVPDDDTAELRPLELPTDRAVAKEHRKHIEANGG